MFMFVGKHLHGMATGGDEQESGWFNIEQAMEMVTFPASLSLMAPGGDIKVGKRRITRKG